MTGFNARFHAPSERWRISDTYTPYNGPDGRPILVKERTCFVAPLLEHQYRLLVAARHMPLQTVNPHILAICANFLINPDSRTCLLLYGNPGTGKTTFMRAMFMVVTFLYGEEIDSKELSARYSKASDLGAILKNDKEDYRNLKRSTCLFIDDLGFSGEGEVVNDYGVKARPIEDIIEHRYDRQLMTVCTTNLTMSGLREKYGPRIYSRICECFSLVAVTGQDYRQQS